MTRGVDPVELERARMQVMQTGYDTQEAPLLRILAYVSFQELAEFLTQLDRQASRFEERRAQNQARAAAQQ